MVLPCFHKIKEVFGDAQITLLTNKPVAAKAAPLEAVLGDSFFFNKILAYPVGTRNVFLLFSLILKIRSLKIDTIVNLTATRSKKSSIRDKLFFKAAGVKQFIGFPEEERDLQISIDPLTGDYEWEANRLVRRLKDLGGIDLDNDKYWDLCLNSSEKSTANDVLKPLSSTDQLIAISLGTKRQSNDWEEHNWIALIKQLSLKFPNWQLVIVGAPDESERAEICLKAWSAESVNLCGKTSPRVSAAVLKKAKLFIGHDSGPLHLAACVGTRCVAIFSSRNFPRQWYPRGAFNRVIQHIPECAGCKLETCIVEKKRCILSISVDEVIKNVEEVLDIDHINQSK